MHRNIEIAVGGPVNADYPKVYKTKFLKPGIPFGLQVMEQNTKYVIKYNFDLGGENVSIPENCVLEFDGGSISNGVLTGQNTVIDAGFVSIFGDDIQLSGTWNVTEAQTCWFDSSLSNAISKAGILSSIIALESDKTYTENGLVINVDNVRIKGNNSIIKAPSSVGYVVKVISSNVVLEGLKVDGHAEFREYVKVTDGNFGGILVGDILSDSVRVVNNISIIDCKVYNCNTIGIAVIGDYCSVRDCEVYNISNCTGAWGYGISGSIFSGFYENRIPGIKNLTVENNKVYNSYVGIFASKSTGILFKDNEVKDIVYLGVSLELSKSSSIISNRIKNTSDNGIDVQECSEISILNNILTSCGSNQVNNNSINCAIFVGDDNPEAGLSDTTLISGNIICGYQGVTGEPKTNGAGIYAHHMNNLTIINNYVKNLSIPSQNSRYWSGMGIFVSHIYNLDIRNNDVQNCDSVGVLVSLQEWNQDTAMGVVTNITSNRLEYTSGIEIRFGNKGAKYVNIDENTIISNNGSKILFKYNAPNIGNSRRLSISRNIVYDSSTPAENYDYAIGLISVAGDAYTLNLNIPIIIENNNVVGSYTKCVHLDTTHLVFTKGRLFCDWNLLNNSLVDAPSKFPILADMPEGSVNITAGKDVYVKGSDGNYTAFGAKQNSYKDLFYKNHIYTIGAGTYRLVNNGLASLSNTVEMQLLYSKDNIMYVATLRCNLYTGVCRLIVSANMSFYGSTFPITVYTKDGNVVIKLIGSETAMGYAVINSSRISLSAEEVDLSEYTRVKNYFVGEKITNWYEATNVEQGSIFSFSDTNRMALMGSDNQVKDAIGNPYTASHSGNSASRPTKVTPGFFYFDTTLNDGNGAPIWFKEVDNTDPDNPVDVWVDATGATV